MKSKCETCENFIPDEVEETSGVCRLTELMVDNDDESCLMYREQEDG